MFKELWHLKWYKIKLSALFQSPLILLTKQWLKLDVILQPWIPETGSGPWYREPRSLSFALVIPAGPTHTHTQLVLNHLWWPQSFQLYRLSFHSICAGHMCVSNMANMANPPAHRHTHIETMGGCICSGGWISTNQIPVWPANRAAGDCRLSFDKTLKL